MLKSTNVNNHKQAEQMIKAGIGSMITGVPTTLQGNPIEMQIYQYLLGGFFGYTARPSYEKEGQKFWAESMSNGSPDAVFYPHKNPEWKNMSKKAKDYINNQVAEQARITLAKTHAWGDPQDAKTSAAIDNAETGVGNPVKTEDGSFELSTLNRAKRIAPKIRGAPAIISPEIPGKP